MKIAVTGMTSINWKSWLVIELNGQLKEARRDFDSNFKADLQKNTKSQLLEKTFNRTVNFWFDPLVDLLQLVAILLNLLPFTTDGIQ